jgi:hypothetical protein
VVDLQGNLCYHQRPVLEQKIVRLEHAASLRVLDRDQREVHRLVRDPVEGMTKCSKSLWWRGGEGGVERLFGIGARFPLIADRELAGDARNSIERPPSPTLSARGREIPPKPDYDGFTRINT